MNMEALRLICFSLLLLASSVRGEDHQLVLGLGGDWSLQTLTLSLIHIVVWGVPLILLTLLILPAFGLNLATIFKRTNEYNNGYNNDGYNNVYKTQYHKEAPTVLDSIVSGIQKSYHKYMG